MSPQRSTVGPNLVRVTTLGESGPGTPRAREGKGYGDAAANQRTPEISGNPL